MYISSIDMESGSQNALFAVRERELYVSDDLK
jgi:hypothetical protein